MNVNGNIALPDNPYIIGRPIYEPECFFGREDLFRFIQDNLKQSVKIILLHGQRRIGKSSVLSQIPNFVRLDEFVFIPLSLQGKSQKPLSDILQDLYVDITDYLRDELALSVDRIIPPSSKDFQENQQKASDSFLTQVYQALAGKNPVLLLDEFDVLDGEGKDVGINQFFSYLKSFVDKHKQLFIIPVVGRRLEDMNTLVLGLFREAPKWEIGLLEEKYAKRLIVEPAQGVLEYNPDAIQAILELSAGHPYFTQVLCFAIFSAAREDGKSQVNRADVERIVDKAIEFSEGGLAWFRNGLPIPERVVFSAVAEAQKIAQLNNNSVGGEPLTLLEEYGVIQTEELVQASRRLVEWGFLDLAEGSDLPLVKVPKYKVKIELVRRWLVKQYPLRQEIWELENLESEAHITYKKAIDLRQKGDIQNVINLYNQALELNPNYFSILFELAEEYYNIKDWDKAVELYKRAYQVAPIRAKIHDSFVKSILNYGRELFQKFLETADFILMTEIDWKPLLNLFTNLQIQLKDRGLLINGVEKKEDSVVIKVNLPSDTNIGHMYEPGQQDYELAFRVLDQIYKDQIKAKDQQTEIYNHQIQDLLEIIKQIASRPINIQAIDTTEKKTMSETIKYDFRGAQFSGGFAENVGGDQIGGSIHNDYGAKQKLNEAAYEIQQLLNQLDKTYPTQRLSEKLLVVEELIKSLESNPTLKEKIIYALKAGGVETFKEQIDHPLVNFVVAALQGWLTEN